MAVHICPNCGTEHSSKKKKRACIFSHMAEEEEMETNPDPMEGELLTEEEVTEEEVVEDQTAEEEEQQEPVEEGFFVKKPVVVKAYQTDKEFQIETPEGTMTASPGDWIITGVVGEQYPCKPDTFKKTYAQCDGEHPPVVIPRRLCPDELRYLATNQTVSVRVEGILTNDYELEVKETEFVRR